MKSYIVIAGLILSLGVLHAQPERMDDDKRMERIEQLRKVRLIEMLEMKEEQSVRFFARLNEHETSRRELMKQKMDALDRIERLLRINAEEKEFEILFAEVDGVERRLIDQRRQFFGGLADILTVQQRAKYLLFERRFEKELKQAMREVQRRRMRSQ